MDKNGQIAKTHVGEPNFAEVYRLAEQPAPIFSGSLPPKKSYLKNKLPINQ
ncbi:MULTISPECIES: hypothetical protein [Eikenella]|uniref:hypothetical protein n=1 Tax=Eikenella TaxID=538 RepID=UPI000A548D62|nr:MULTISPECIES: hypothetical protein [Eikenella]